MKKNQRIVEIETIKHLNKVIYELMQFISALESTNQSQNPGSAHNYTSQSD